VTVARLEEVGVLIERIVTINQSLFIERAQDYREQHRAGTSRSLSPTEAAQVAAVLADAKPLTAAEQAQGSELRAYDEPSGPEILLAAGIAVAPAFIKATRQVVALVEMPAAEFKRLRELDRREGGTELADAIDEAAVPLGDLTLEEGRERASRAFAHYAAAAGFDPGEALGLPVQAVWQALKGALATIQEGVSQSSQLIALPRVRRVHPRRGPLQHPLAGSPRADARHHGPRTA
jgi:hypothetical protein